MAAAASRFFDSDLWWSFRRSPTAVLSALVALLCIGGAVLAPWIAPQDPFDLATLNLIDAFKPPVWAEGGDAAFPLGSDDQGRDVFSAILHGARISLLVGVCAVLFSTLVGVAVGLSAGYLGGMADAVLMRIADIQLTFPSILVALLVDGVELGLLLWAFVEPRLWRLCLLLLLGSASDLALQLGPQASLPLIVGAG